MGFAHDWMPALFFITVFEEVSFLSLSIRSGWQNAHLVAFESLVLASGALVGIVVGLTHLGQT